MPASRRSFLQALAASSACATFPDYLAASVAAQSLAVQEKLAADPLRPQFHLLPAKNWMNDPNGPIYWKGHYHMFFQYNPNAAIWGDMHWAHAISDDMIHWRHLPIALAPTPGGDDSEGCFTGSAVDDHGIATFLYTGVKTTAPARATLRDGHNTFREVQCLATSADPQLLTWRKSPSPVIQPPDDPTLAGFRDPFLWRQRDDWILGVASGHFKKGGCVLLYRSKDLRSWDPAGELTSGHWSEKPNTNPVDSGEMWECPDFFQLGEKHVLLYSTAGQVAWESGELDLKELKFHSEKSGILDHGAYYAQKTQLDKHGQRILWGWIPEKRPDSELIAAGWAGCMALPRVLTLNSEGELQMQFAPEVQSLREQPSSLSDQSPVAKRAALQKLSLTDLRAELVFKIPPAPTSSPFAITLRDRTGPWWSASLAPGNPTSKLVVNNQALQIPAVEAAPHNFHLILDASVAELIVNNQHAFTSRIYRQPDGPLTIQIADDHLSALTSFQAWQLKPISPNRLTT
jgi:beta-fructofuranosidase